MYRVSIIWSPDKLRSPDEKGAQVRDQGRQARRGQGLQQRDQGVGQHLQEERGQ